MTCTTCSAKLTGTAKFCASCGAPRPLSDAKGASKSIPKSEAKPAVDPLGMTAPDAFAETANANTRAELDRALARYDAKQRAGTTPAGPAPPQVATQEMRESVPSPFASPQVSPKAASHVAPQAKQPKTAAMPASSHKIAVAPMAPGVHVAQGGSPQARVPLAPTSTTGMPPMNQPEAIRHAPTGPPGSVAGAAPPRVSPVPFPQPIRGRLPSLAPGLPVTVVWANGQRYRGTIVQLLGTRVLVVFPDGQQHWVEMSYITPA